jgi:hypothetical protein
MLTMVLIRWSLWSWVLYITCWSRSTLFSAGFTDNKKMSIMSKHYFCSVISVPRFFYFCDIVHLHLQQHGASSAEHGRRHFDLFNSKETPERLPDIHEGPPNLTESNVICSSRLLAESRRVIQYGGAHDWRKKFWKYFNSGISGQFFEGRSGNPKQRF